MRFVKMHCSIIRNVALGKKFSQILVMYHSLWKNLSSCIELPGISELSMNISIVRDISWQAEIQRRASALQDKLKFCPDQEMPCLLKCYTNNVLLQLAIWNGNGTRNGHAVEQHWRREKQLMFQVDDLASKVQNVRENKLGRNVGWGRGNEREGLW